MPRHYIGERTVHDVGNFKEFVVLRIAETRHPDHLDLDTCGGRRWTAKLKILRLITSVLGFAKVMIHCKVTFLLCAFGVIFQLGVYTSNSAILTACHS